MGSWSVYCSVSQIAITAGQKCVLIPLKKQRNYEYLPLCLPVFGEYNDYGGIENIEENENTKLLEEYFCVSIDEFVTFFLDGKNTYDREEAKEVEEKINHLDEIKDCKFMWIDRQVYDFMIVNQDEYHKGYMDYGAIIGEKDSGFDLGISETLIKMIKEKGQEVPEYLLKRSVGSIGSKYLENLETFRDSLVHLMNIRSNLHAMSGYFAPFIVYLTPQSGEREQHQKLLNKFSEINKSYTE